MDALATREALRADLATLVGGRKEDIAFTPNTTFGVHLAARAIDWQAGDNVFVFDGEFPANIIPWQNAAKDYGLNLHTLSLKPFSTSLAEGVDSVETYAKAHPPRVIALSAVQFQTGLRLPLKALAEIAHRHHGELCVDGIQALGAVPIAVDVDDVDYLTAGGHKWLMGIEGAGFMYVSERAQKRWSPKMSGWLGVENGLDFLSEGANHLNYEAPLQKNAAALEVGTFSNLGLAALSVSIPIINDAGSAHIFETIQRYHNALEKELVALGFRSLRHPEAAGRSGILSVLPPATKNAKDVWQALLDQGISCAFPDGHIRFAPHFTNSRSEVDTITEVCRQILAI